MNFRTRLIAILIPTLLPGIAVAGTIQFGAPDVESNRYEVPITLSGGDGQVSAMDFRVQYDPTVFRPVSISPGPMALQANKQVVGNGPSPGEYVVIMHGINQNTVGNGEVAKLVFERIDGNDGASRLNIVEPTLADADGGELPASGGGRNVGRNTNPDTGGNTGGGDPNPSPEPGSETPSEEPASTPAPETPAAEPVSQPSTQAMANPGLVASGTMLPGSASTPGSIVIPTAKRPTPEESGTNLSGSKPAAAGQTPRMLAQAETGESLGTGASPRPLSAPREAANSADSPKEKNLAVSGQDDVRMAGTGIGTGTQTIESNSGGAGIAGATAIADGADDTARRVMVAALAALALLAAGAMMALRRRLFR